MSKKIILISCNEDKLNLIEQYLNNRLDIIPHFLDEELYIKSNLNLPFNDISNNLSKLKIKYIKSEYNSNNIYISHNNLLTVNNSIYLNNININSRLKLFNNKEINNYSSISIYYNNQYYFTGCYNLKFKLSNLDNLNNLNNNVNQLDIFNINNSIINYIEYIKSEDPLLYSGIPIFSLIKHINNLYRI